MPYNKHTKAFHYYVGSGKNTYGKYLMLTQGTLMIELPVAQKSKDGTTDTSDTGHGFLFDRLYIGREELKKLGDYGSIYSIEFGGLVENLEGKGFPMD